MMKRILYKVFLVSILLFTNSYVFSQINIKSPTCAVLGTTYQYNITGNTDSTSGINVCVMGGVTADSASNIVCTQQRASINKVLAIWDYTIFDGGSLSFTSSSGISLLSIHFTQPLLPGSIDSVCKTQFIEMNTLPAPITCSADNASFCSPSYLYQWQQSADAISWTDISGAVQGSNKTWINTNNGLVYNFTFVNTKSI